MHFAQPSWYYRPCTECSFFLFLAWKRGYTRRKRPAGICICAVMGKLDFPWRVSCCLSQPHGATVQNKMSRLGQSCLFLHFISCSPLCLDLFFLVQIQKLTSIVETGIASPWSNCKTLGTWWKLSEIILQLVWAKDNMIQGLCFQIPGSHEDEGIFSLVFLCDLSINKALGFTSKALKTCSLVQSTSCHLCMKQINWWKLWCLWPAALG